MAREARKAFEKEASAEIWIPFSLSPVKFVRVSSAKGTYDIRETTRIDQDQAFELGKPYVALCWRDTCLCLIVPSRAYVTMSTFTFAKDERTWSTEEVVPRVFANNLADFQDSLYAVERQFAPLLKVWDGRERLSRASAQLQAIGRSAEAWRRVQIPDAQKLDTLSPASLSSSASTMIADETNVILVSAASAWEIATKVRIGKLPGAETLEKEFLDVREDAGYTLLDINVECALRAGRLVGEHRDPFDRMIAAQALADDIPVLSADPKLDAFGVRRLW
jgi:PIN domain nuclease of toxin-antitoxin system